MVYNFLIQNANQVDYELLIPVEFLDQFLEAQSYRMYDSLVY